MSIEDMIIIAFRGLRNSIRGKTLWQLACLTLLWIVWQERHAGIFEDKGRSEGMLWDLLHFYSSLWASCTIAFRGVPLSVLQLNWIVVCDSKVWDSWGSSLYIVFYRGVYLYFDQILYFEGRTSHPSLVFFLLLIHYSLFLIKKK